MDGKWEKIKAFAFDVDGVLTNGGVFADNDGNLFRTFDAKDAFAMRMAYMHGYKMAIITGGHSQSIVQRMKICGITSDDVYLNSRNKIADFNKFCEKYSLAPEEVMYFGDDIPDVPVMKACGVGVCPCDAVHEAVEAADYVSEYPGGRLCVRDTLEKVMSLHGKWVLDIDHYEKSF